MPASYLSRFDGSDNSLSAAAIERRKVNFAIRRKEFSALRLIINEGKTRPVAVPGAAFVNPSAQAVVLKSERNAKRTITVDKINQIEAQMADYWSQPASANGASPRSFGGSSLNSVSSSVPSSSPELQLSVNSKFLLSSLFRSDTQASHTSELSQTSHASTQFNAEKTEKFVNTQIANWAELTAIADFDAHQGGTKVVPEPVKAVPKKVTYALPIQAAAFQLARGELESLAKTLKAAMAAESAYRSDKFLWAMVFEYANLIGDHAAFKDYAQQFYPLFGLFPPEWNKSLSQYAATRAEETSGSKNGNSTISPPTSLKLSDYDLNASDESPDAMQQSFAHFRSALNDKILDADLASIDIYFPKYTDLAELDEANKQLYFNFFKLLCKSPKPLVLHEFKQHYTVLKNICLNTKTLIKENWLILLQIENLLNNISEFEEYSILYATLIEESPPLWIDRNPGLHILITNSTSTVSAGASTDGSIQNTIDITEQNAAECKIVVNGVFQIWNMRVLEYFFARNNLLQFKKITFDCKDLFSMNMTSVGLLYNVIKKCHTNGADLNFVNVNCFVAVLLDMLGITEISWVNLKKL